MNKTSKIILEIVIVLLLEIIGVQEYLLKKNKNESNKKIDELQDKIDNAEKNDITDENSNENSNEVSNTTNNESNSNEISNTTNKESNSNKISNTVTEKNNNSTTGIKKIRLDDVAIVKILMNVKDFENAQTLTNNEYLAIAYNAINEGYIVIDKDRSPSSGKSEVEYTTDEINSVIYSLFGVKLTKFENYGSVLKYSNGKYKLQFSDKGSVNSEAKRITDEVAAGTKYINYDYYVTEENKVEDKGSYYIGINSQTGFVTKKMKMD